MTSTASSSAPRHPGGLGVDRLVIFLNGLTIGETLPFPPVRHR
ncbi:hypothetical protein [Streptomyces sp. LBL]|nr:hypothetical protein [Streptomyces sp. LBL]